MILITPAQSIFDGVATIDGFTVFVPDTTTGDTVEVEITDVKPNFAFAERVD